MQMGTFPRIPTVFDDLLAAFRLILRPILLVLNLLGLYELENQLGKFNWIKYIPPSPPKLPPPPGLLPGGKPYAPGRLYTPQVPHEIPPPPPGFEPPSSSRLPIMADTERQHHVVTRRLTPRSIEEIQEDDADDGARRRRLSSRSKGYYVEEPRSSMRADRMEPAFEELFKPTEDIQFEDTETGPKFHIYPKECPYRVVIAPYNPDLNSTEFPLMPILQFWTWHTWLNVKLPTSREQNALRSNAGPGLARGHIADESGDWCGSIVLDEGWIKSKPSASQELIAISEAKTFNRNECEAWTYYIPKERDQSEWDLFYVLLIERKQEKWERVGLGKVFKEAFMRTATWKEIMLD